MILVILAGYLPMSEFFSYSICPVPASMTIAAFDTISGSCDGSFSYSVVSGCSVVASSVFSIAMDVNERSRQSIRESNIADHFFMACAPYYLQPVNRSCYKTIPNTMHYLHIDNLFYYILKRVSRSDLI